MSIRTRSRARNVLVGGLICLALVASACTRPVSPAPNAVPTGTDVVAKMRSLVDSPAFQATLDPTTREQTLDAIRQWVDSPGAVADANQFAANNSALLTATGLGKEGRLPGVGPLGGTTPHSDVPDPAGTDRQPPPPADTYPPTPEDTSLVVPSQDISTPVQPTPPGYVSAAPPVEAVSGRFWPDGGQSSTSVPWPVYTGGETSDLLSAVPGWALPPPPGIDGGDLPYIPDPNQPYLRTVGKCDAAHTGTRHVPAQPIPIFQGKVFLPDQNSWLIKGDPGNYSGPSLETRLDPQGSGIRQFKVEGHLLSTLQVPGSFWELNQMRPHVVVDQIGDIGSPGGIARSYFPGTPRTEFHKLCYAEDLGGPAFRGYFQAWIPLADFALSPELDEPGFQVRAESVDNYHGNDPAVFMGADQHWVHVGPKPHLSLPLVNPPLQSIGLHLNSNLVVKRDATPNISDTIKQPLADAIVNALKNQSVHGGAFGVGGSLNIDDPGTPGVNLDLTPVRNKGNGQPDDEDAIKATLQLNGLKVSGVLVVLWGLVNVGCGYKATLEAGVGASGTIKIGNPDSSQLGVNLNVGVESLAVPSLSVFPIAPNLESLIACGLGNLVNNAKLLTYVQDLANTKISDAVTGLLGDTYDLGIRDAIKGGWSSPNGNGFGAWFQGFDRTCVPNGCDGGDMFLDDHGLHASVSLGAYDRKGFGERRFEWTHKSTLTTTMADAIRTTTAPNGQEYEAAAFIDPLLINEILRAVTDGAKNQHNGFLDVAPFQVNTPGGPVFISVSPKVAPFVLAPLEPNPPALDIYIPNILVSGGGNQFAIDVRVQMDLVVDANTRKLKASIKPKFQVNTLECGLHVNVGVLSPYAACASQNWKGGQVQPPIGSLPDILNNLNPALQDLVKHSIDQIDIPPVNSGFDPLQLGSIEVRNLDGLVGVYLGVGQHGEPAPPQGTPPAPTGLHLTGSGCCNTYGDWAWDAVPGATDYQVYMEGYFGGGCVTDADASVAAPATSVRVQSAGLCLGTKYDVRIRAKRSGLWGPWSPDINVRL